MPVPGGLSETEILNFLKTVRPVDAPPREMENYCNQDWRRFVHTWSLTAGLKGTCLELGANPYFTTMLLKQLVVLCL